MKILIIYATAGAGHRRAAEALYDGFRAQGNPEATIIDALDYTLPFHKQAYSGSYTFLVTHAAWLWKIIFHLVNRPWLLPLIAGLRRRLHAVIARRLNRFLVEGNFDYIFTTHFLANEIVSHLKKTGAVRSKLITVVTDFDVHRMWLADTVDMYTAASDRTKTKLQQLGVPEDKVTVTGIPVHSQFVVPKNKEAIRHRLELKANVFTVLIATGSFGIGPIEQVIETAKEFQVVVVCGHNKNLYYRLNSEKVHSESVKVFGLVKNMEELMAISDIMISKPGGLSIAEALATGLPLIFFNAIPGQETGNVKILKEYGIGIDTRNIEDIRIALQHFRECPEDLQRQKEKIKTLARPNAVKDIIALAK